MGPPQDRDGSYGSKEYWERRYEQQQQTEDWLVPWTTLAPVVLPHLAPSNAIVILGSGTSTIGEELWDAGFHDVVGVDYAASAVAQMNARTNGRTGLSYLEGDVRALPLREESIDVALDKGTLDALACTDDPEAMIAAMARDVARVLRPGGRWLIVSMRAPRNRLAYFAGWQVTVERIAKPEPQLTGKMAAKVAALRAQALAAASEEERLEQTSCWLYALQRETEIR